MAWTRDHLGAATRTRTFIRSSGYIVGQKPGEVNQPGVLPSIKAIDIGDLEHLEQPHAPEKLSRILSGSRHCRKISPRRRHSAPTLRSRYAFNRKSHL